MNIRNNKTMITNLWSGRIKGIETDSEDESKDNNDYSAKVIYNKINFNMPNVLCKIISDYLDFGIQVTIKYEYNICNFSYKTWQGKYTQGYHNEYGWQVQFSLSSYAGRVYKINIYNNKLDLKLNNIEIDSKIDIIPEDQLRDYEVINDNSNKSCSLDGFIGDSSRFNLVDNASLLADITPRVPEPCPDTMLCPKPCSNAVPGPKPCSTAEKMITYKSNNTIIRSNNLSEFINQLRHPQEFNIKDIGNSSAYNYFSLINYPSEQTILFYNPEVDDENLEVLYELGYHKNKVAQSHKIWNVKLYKYILSLMKSIWINNCDNYNGHKNVKLFWQHIRDSGRTYSDVLFLVWNIDGFINELEAIPKYMNYYSNPSCDQ